MRHTNTHKKTLINIESNGIEWILTGSGKKKLAKAANVIFLSFFFSGATAPLKQIDNPISTIFHLINIGQHSALFYLSFFVHLYISRLNWAIFFDYHDDGIAFLVEEFYNKKISLIWMKINEKTTTIYNNKLKFFFSFVCYCCCFFPL